MGQEEQKPTGDELKERVEKAFKPATDSPSHGDIVFLAMLNESLLDKEFRLSNDRVSWTMNAQAFLFTAFCVILANSEKATVKDWLWLLKVLPIVACVFIVGGLVGFYAAHRVTFLLEGERSFYQLWLSKIFNAELKDVGVLRQKPIHRTRLFGISPFIAIASLLLGLWIAIAVYAFRFVKG